MQEDYDSMYLIIADLFFRHGIHKETTGDLESLADYFGNSRLAQSLVLDHDSRHARAIIVVTFQAVLVEFGAPLVHQCGTASAGGGTRRADRF